MIRASARNVMLKDVSSAVPLIPICACFVVMGLLLTIMVFASVLVKEKSQTQMESVSCAMSKAVPAAQMVILIPAPNAKIALLIFLRASAFALHQARSSVTMASALFRVRLLKPRVSYKKRKPIKKLSKIKEQTLQMITVISLAFIALKIIALCAQIITILTAGSADLAKTSAIVAEDFKIVLFVRKGLMR